MKRILLTGLSATGKSTVIHALAERGYQAVDLDSDAFSEWVTVNHDEDIAGMPVEPDRDWVWREDRIQKLLSTDDTDVLILSGCASNMGKFRSQFDRIILLSASADVIVERLATRTDNSYGKQPEEVARVLDLKDTVEPLLRKAADHEIDTSASLDDVLAGILYIAQSLTRIDG